MTIISLHSKPTTKVHKLFKQYCVYIEVEKGRIIFREGDQANGLYLIESGIVQVCKHTENGKEMTLFLSGPDAIIGESKLFSEIRSHSISAKAMHPTELLYLPLTTLECLLMKDNLAIIDYLKWVQHENLKNQSRIQDLLMHGKKGAICSTIIRLSNTYGEVLEDGSIFIRLALTNTDIANLCATSREVVNRMLNDLKKLNVITFDKGFITVMDLAYLKRCIACDHCSLEICRID